MNIIRIFNLHNRSGISLPIVSTVTWLSSTYGSGRVLV